ncbi:MAG: TetR/AcrR family transcriptional regulator [Parvibaculum sp.]|uniref:TetR/AcrR family transcriptional regulator n=1 Tax=Parvibaculum sp. TaxID=2024848 RepID=UPI002AB8F886|nr:TetR/AcrR family transcriptional regulator [Parvibaculum sp.]MDZ4381529.1 TetR/AcrR family transcriptional regulator [Parvibaculum sp.]
MARTVSERSDVLPLLAEAFREHGYEGASLALIGEATGLGRGSLYHFFPGGKEEMASAVLGEIEAWFETNIFKVLRTAEHPESALLQTLDATEEYFRSGRRICLVGAFALSDTRDRFSLSLRRYFSEWRAALEFALSKTGETPAEAAAHAEEIVLSIQGALVLARALDDPGIFSRAIGRVRSHLPKARTKRRGGAPRLP